MNNEHTQPTKQPRPHLILTTELFTDKTIWFTQELKVRRSTSGSKNKNNEKLHGNHIPRIRFVYNTDL